MKPGDIYDRIVRLKSDRELQKQIARVEKFLQSIPAQVESEAGPVLFFNASTRIHRLSINAAFSLLSAWGLRQVGIPVLYAVCQRGMEQCILGTNRENLQASPPCKHCIPFSERLFPNELVQPLILDKILAEELERGFRHSNLDELIEWRYREIPLGELCIPGLRWALRRHNLPDDVQVQELFRKYLTSAASLVEGFEDILDRHGPRALVLFNGISYPEAVARYLAQMRDIPVITHEVGLQPHSAFFSHKDATFREIELSAEAQLRDEEKTQLDHYLGERFKGNFTMAGIQFWPQMEDIPEDLQQRIGKHRHLVPVFTNVIFDTSQIHANTIYQDMFAWLDDLEDVIRDHPNVLFVFRAHPDEDRPGKESRETVQAWFEKSRLNNSPNVYFFSASEYINSYDLIRRAKLVLVYNSSIGLEASIMGAPVLCAGRARYTQLPTTFFPGSQQAYREKLAELLVSEHIDVPQEFTRNAKMFLHYELYRASLDLSEFLRPYPDQAGMTLLTDFDPADLERSLAIRVIRDGILFTKPFVYPRMT